MSDHTGIEWTEATWNPVVGCTQVSPGCAHCYAKTLHDRRHRAVLEGAKLAPQYAEPFEVVQLKPDRLRQPLGWKRGRLVFVNSVSDLFHDDVPDEYLDRAFAVMALTRQHSYQVLTKRPARMREYVKRLGTPAGYDRLEAAARSVGYTIRFEGIPLVPWPIPNVWLGVSVENQRFADERIPILLQTPAAVRFLSCEPLLGELDLRSHLSRVDWVIVGGESGKGARTMAPEWARSLRDQCLSAAVPFFFKQWGGERAKRDHDAALLDGERWTMMPNVEASVTT